MKEGDEVSGLIEPGACFTSAFSKYRARKKGI